MGSPNVLAIGTFDGVHLGHRAILDRLGQIAQERGGRRVVYAFAHPPRFTTRPDHSAGLLLPLDVRIDLLRRTADHLVLASFADVRELAPRAFAEQVLADELCVSTVVVGVGFRFGQGRTADVATLQRLGEDLGFDVVGVPHVLVEDRPVSSTRIRSLLRAGRVLEAGRLLGRPPVLIGRVAAGDRIGRSLGHPTANLALDPEVLLPGDGIYFARAIVDGQRAHGLLYIGRRPTFGTDTRRCELHLLANPQTDLYDLWIEVHVMERMRDDRPFESPDELRAQIDRDVRAATDLARRHSLTFDSIRG